MALRSPEAAAPLEGATPTVAAFDFDGTLTDGGSTYPFLVALRGRWRVWRVGLRLLPDLARAAVLGGTAADDVKERLFSRTIGGLPLEEVQRRGARFAHEHLAHYLRRDTFDRLQWHLDQGHHVVVVSASPELYVRPAGEELGAHGVVATRLAVGGGGLMTGGYEGKNCRGAEKYAQLVVHLRAQGLLNDKGRISLWAYGNSRGDLRLLHAADYGVDCGKLGPFGRLRRFPRLVDVRSRGGA